MPSGIPEGAMCVQKFNDSRESAIHITYRNSLRSSSMREPRDPLLKVLKYFISIENFLIVCNKKKKVVCVYNLWALQPKEVKYEKNLHSVK